MKEEPPLCYTLVREICAQRVREWNEWGEDERLADSRIHTKSAGW